MSVEHVKLISEVGVTESAVVVSRADHFIVDGVLVASAETQESINRIPPLAEIRDNKLALLGTFPIGAHLHFTVGGTDLTFDLAESVDQNGIVPLIVLPDGMNLTVDMDEADYATVLGFQTGSGETDPLVDAPVTSVSLTNVTMPSIPDDAKALLMGALGL
jgi:hypothetical protein